MKSAAVVCIIGAFMPGVPTWLTIIDIICAGYCGLYIIADEYNP